MAETLFIQFIRGWGRGRCVTLHPYLFVRAIEAAQSLDPIKIRDAMKKTDFEGLEGHIKFEDFDNYKNQGRYTPWLIQWVNGERTVTNRREKSGHIFTSNHY